MNSDLRDLQIILADRVRLLAKQLDDVTDEGEAKNILNEIREFNHRVSLVGSLLFREQSQALSEKVEIVRRAKSKVDRAIKDIADMEKMLEGVSKFLSLVDEAIDLAKML